MRRLSQRASELDREMYGPPTRGIIDTTNRASEHGREAGEALAAKFVKDAIADDDVLRVVSGDDWNLVPDYKITSHRVSLVAGPLKAIKRVIRRLVRFYTDFLVIRQSYINRYLVQLCSQLVREHVRAQLQAERDMQRLKSAIGELERKVSSNVAAINARFDNNEARLDLFRSELEVRSDLMREERQPMNFLTRADDKLDDGSRNVALEGEPATEAVTTSEPEGEMASGAKSDEDDRSSLGG